MTRLLKPAFLALLLLAACAPSTLSQRERVGGLLEVGYQAQAPALLDALASGGPTIQPGDNYGFLNLRARRGNAVLLAATRLGGVGQLDNEALAAEIVIEASVTQEGERAVVTLRGEPLLSGAVADARRQLVALLDARFERAELDPLSPGDMQ